MAGAETVKLEFDRPEYEDFVNAVSGALTGLVSQVDRAKAKDGGLQFFPNGIERVEVRVNVLKYAEFTFIVAGKDGMKLTADGDAPGRSVVVLDEG